MTLKSIFTLFFVCTCISLQAQKETWHWYFGSKAGLDFSSGVPIADTNSVMGAPEGASSISDSAGNLLFYTNGIKVWNKIHQVMENGDSLMGHPSSTESSIIVKQPNNDSIYYIFTQDAGDSYIYTPPHKGFRYSIVNINLNNGLGKIIEKNIFITDSTTERVTVIKHCNGKDYWIITQKKNCNTYYSFILSNNGISTIPMISQTNVILPNAESIGCGYMKSSPNGDKIAVAFCTDNMLGTNAILLNFDNSTGLLTNPISIGCPASSTLQGYGLEFSLNQKFLYVSYALPSGSSTSQIYQYDTSSNDSATISHTGVQLYWGYDTTTFTHLESSGALQMACDHKIYIAFAGYPYVGVINYPDSVGLACDFVKNGVYLNGRICNFGLPTFFPGFFNIISDFTYTQNCLNLNFSGVCDTASLVSVSWNFGDGASGVNNISGLFNPLHRFSDTGSYTVRVYYNYPCRTDSVVKTINVQLLPYVFPQSYISDSTTALCKQLSFMPVCDSASLDSLVWVFGDVASGVNNSSTEFNPFHTFTDIGNYQIKLILYAYCRTDTIYKTVNVSLPIVYLGADTTLCDAATLILNPHFQTDLPTSFHWQNGDTSSTFTVTQAGT
ncbi:MAG: PKD domain-containing protein, partial [Bacteroidota bacterium]